MLYFTGTPNAQGVLLTWATAIEINNHAFYIERSEDGKTFYTIGRKEGAGNSSTVTSYSYTDTQPLEGIVYYRLRQQDEDGTESHSKIIAVNRSLTKNTLTVFPNPAQADITILVSSGELTGIVTARLYNVLGQEVLVKSVPAETLASGLTVDVADLAKGTYTLKVIGSSNEWVEQLIKE